MTDSKVIAIIPTRNESWILSRNIQTLLEFCDYIVVSTDPQDDEFNEDFYDDRVVSVRSTNSELSESNLNRRQCALDKARSLASEPLIIAVDADEIFSSEILDLSIASLSKITPGTGFTVNFRELWFSPYVYRNDIKSNWSNRRMPCIWRDDGSNYPNGNRHEARIPPGISKIQHLDLDLLHLARVPCNRYWSRIRYYILHETVRLGKNPWKINYFYSITYDYSLVSISPVPPEWYQHWISINPGFLAITDIPDNWFLKASIECIRDAPSSLLQKCDVWDYDWSGYIAKYQPAYDFLLTKISLINQKIPNHYKHTFLCLRRTNNFPPYSPYFLWLFLVQASGRLGIYHFLNRILRK